MSKVMWLTITGLCSLSSLIGLTGSAYIYDKALKSLTPTNLIPLFLISMTFGLVFMVLMIFSIKKYTKDEVSEHG